MTLTIFLGKLIGVYCLIVGLTMMANRRTMVDAVNTLIRSPPLVLLAGVFAVAVGLAMVIDHNVWSGGALPVVVTLVGWASLIKGVVVLGPFQRGKCRTSTRHYTTSGFILALWAQRSRSAST
jgi:hypothetical protein